MIQVFHKSYQEIVVHMQSKIKLANRFFMITTSEDFSWLYNSIVPCQNWKYVVMRKTLAKMLWQKLEDKYTMKSTENWLHLKKKLYCFHK